MATFEEAVITYKKSLDGKQNIIPWWPGYMGDGAGVVNTASEQMCLVRYPFANSPAVPVLDLTGVARVDGLAVKVGYLPWSPGNLQIIAVDDQRLNPSNPADTPIAPGATNGYTTYPSAANLGFLSVDPVYIDISQVTTLSVQPSSGLSVQIWPGTIPRPGIDAFVPAQLVDLTASVPVSGARYALISYDSTGAVVVTDGAINAGGFPALTQADIPATPAGNWRTAAIALYAGQTEIVRTRGENDFWDLRFPEESTAGAVAPGDITLTDAHIIVGNASNVGADVAMSNDATISNTGALTLKNTGPGATGPIGTATLIPVVTIDAQGRTTALTSIAIDGSALGHWEVLMADGVTPPDPLMTEDETDWLYGFVAP